MWARVFNIRVQPGLAGRQNSEAIRECEAQSQEWLKFKVV
jgi:hypothetical protein